MNVFDCAIKIEEEAENYYKGLEEEASEPELKTLFAILAAAEREHRDKLVRLRRTTAPHKASLDDLDHKVCSFKPQVTQQELLNEIRNDPDLYKFTVREEEEEIRFYEEMAAMANNETTRRTLLMLADEERRHLDTMENIYEFVEAPKTYLASGEFSNLTEL
ncbi:ferritin family protein [Geomonas sp. Red32]|uniref:ferritin-like domain-containing protein n=1 Tax=Geomonas sp. Red32 TaxID=2912856 RepID=UPI00202D09E8|nr:ferritin family protein [Geomonas sp. Red32]MCM0083878.1 ferritin family protein [Geomonas sp. Red32]